MKYKKGDFIKLLGQGDIQFQIIEIAEHNLMLVKKDTNQLWSCHPDDINEEN
jgi:hypothetical protein